MYYNIAELFLVNKNFTSIHSNLCIPLISAATEAAATTANNNSVASKKKKNKSKKKKQPLSTGSATTTTTATSSGMTSSSSNVVTAAVPSSTGVSGKRGSPEGPAPAPIDNMEYWSSGEEDLEFHDAQSELPGQSCDCHVTTCAYAHLSFLSVYRLVWCTLYIIILWAWTWYVGYDDLCRCLFPLC